MLVTRRTVQEDMERGDAAIEAAIALADNTMLGGASDSLGSGVLPLRHALAQAGGSAARATLEGLVALLMTPVMTEQLQLLNPLLAAHDAQQVEAELVTGLLLTCRAGHLARIKGLVAQLLALLRQARAAAADRAASLVTAVKLKAKAVAE